MKSNRTPAADFNRMRELLDIIDNCNTDTVDEVTVATYELQSLIRDLINRQNPTAGTMQQELVDIIAALERQFNQRAVAPRKAHWTITLVINNTMYPLHVGAECIADILSDCLGSMLDVALDKGW